MIFLGGCYTPTMSEIEPALVGPAIDEVLIRLTPQILSAFSRLKKEHVAAVRRVESRYSGARRLILIQKKGDEFQAKVRQLLEGTRTEWSEPPIAG